MSKKKSIREYKDLRQAEQKYPLPPETGESDKYLYSHTIPEVPAYYNKEYRYTGEGKVYLINPFIPSCTCSEYEENKAKCDLTDIRILCRHILSKYKQLRIYDSFDSLTKILIRAVVLFNEKELFHYKKGKTEFFTGGLNEGGWINIFALSNEKDYAQYSYNVKEQRWSYKIAPPGEKIIIRLLFEKLNS